MVKRESMKEIRHHSRRYSIKEGMYSSAKGSLLDRFIAPFAVALNASNTLIAFLSAFSGLLGPFSQVYASHLMRKTSRKKVVLSAIFLESVMILPFVIIAFLFYFNIVTGILPIALLVFFSLYFIFANLSSPGWFSWMGDLVDERYRGRWFAKRTFLTGLVGVTLSLFAAFALDFSRSNNFEIFGFAFLFFLAMTMRFLSFGVMKKQYDPKFIVKKKSSYTFKKFLKEIPKTNFGKFSLFRALLGFSSAISSSLVVVYLLRHLEFSYLSYILIILSAVLFSLLFLDVWGKLSDKFGNYFVLSITSIIIPVIPLLWLVSGSFIYLLLVPGFISGISWGGFNLVVPNFVYDNVEKEKRPSAISYFRLLNGFGIFFGAALGGLLIGILKGDLFQSITLIFFISAFLRMVFVFYFIPRLKEVKRKRSFKSYKVFKEMSFKDVKPILIEEVHQVMSIKDYLREK